MKNFDVTFDFREFFHFCKLSIRNPRKLFAEVKSDKDYKKALGFSIAISTIGSLLGLVQITILIPFLSRLLPNIFGAITTVVRPPTVIEIAPAFLMSTVFVVLFSFVYAYIIYFVLSLFKIKGKYIDIYKSYVYSRAPISLLGWIPFLGEFVGLYSMYVLGVGISELYGITKKRAFLVLIPLVILFVIIQAVLFFSIKPAS